MSYRLLLSWMRHATLPDKKTSQSCFICCVSSGFFYCFCTAMPGFFFSPPQHRTNVEWIICYFYQKVKSSQKQSKTKNKPKKSEVRAILVLHCNLPELTTRILPPCLCYTLFISSPIHAGLHSHSVHGLTERGNEHRGRRQTARAFPGTYSTVSTLRPLDR